MDYLCDSARCHGTARCRIVMENLCQRDFESLMWGHVAFPCEWVEPCTGSGDCPAPKHWLGCFASMPEDMVTMTLDEFETKYLS